MARKARPSTKGKHARNRHYKQVAHETGLKPFEVKNIVEAMMRLITKELGEHGSFVLADMLHFKKSRIRGYPYQHPKMFMGKFIQIGPTEPRLIPRIWPMEKFNQMLNEPTYEELTEDDSELETHHLGCLTRAGSTFAPAP